ncbi:MAG: transmembrane amino acid transporter protein-domain-containing protein [Benniella sp.]|nr:MAG: transmembrane amino acid transporter protein-domain-containing protein [Benniella sp.]
MYNNYGGRRSRGTSSFSEESISAVEKGGPSSHLNERQTSGPASSGGEPVRGNVSALKASFLLGKAFVGTGVLFLPKAFSNGGLLFSCLMLGVDAFICCAACLLLVKVRLIVRQEMGQVLFGKYMRLSVFLSVALSQIGFVCAYLIFVSQNINAIVQTFTKCTFQDIQEKYYIFIPLVVLIPLVLIRRMAVLSVPSMFANVFIIVGIVYLWYYSIQHLVQHGAGPDIALFNQNDFALFIGTAVFSFEGIGLSKFIPITESMAEPEKFPRVLAVTMAVVALIFGSVGALCYSSFGSEIQTIVLLNLPVRDGMTITVEILYSCAIILSVPLMLSPASRIIEHGIFGNKSGADYFNIKILKNILRMLACLCFIFPVMFHCKACARTATAKALDIALGVFGVAAMARSVAWLHQQPLKFL